jgi:hypothetical protein
MTESLDAAPNEAADMLKRLEHAPGHLSRKHLEALKHWAAGHGETAERVVRPTPLVLPEMEDTPCAD